MVKKLRKQFVIVTTMMMITVFGIFFISNTLYNSYWNRQEISGMLDWIAHCGIFFSSQDAMDKEEIVADILDEERPIWGVVLDDKGTILSTQIIGRESGSQLDEAVIRDMCNDKGTKMKMGHYYYSYSKIRDDRILLVIMDERTSEPILLKILGMVCLISAGIMVLIVITFFLSKYITKPAEDSLLREKRFISDASHELKTPLGAISINAQALALDPSNSLYIKNIVSESERMSRLIERLLLMSKLDEADKVETHEINISEICDEMALTYECMAFEMGAEFIYQIEPDIIMNGCEDELRQLLAILIDNAFKNLNENGTVCMSLKKEKKIVIEVSNTGKGISEEDLPHIFDRFYTTDKSRKNSSFGLGLAIAKSIVVRHGGTIGVNSILDNETVFRVEY